MLSFVLCGCNQKTQTTGSTPEGVEAKAEAENILHRLPTLHVEDTVKSGSNVYALMINREACDSLGIVTDAKVTLSAVGSDEEAAVNALEALLQRDVY